MGPHDEFVAKWSRQLGAGLAIYDEPMDPGRLRSDSFYVSRIVVIPDSMAGSGDLLVAFNSAADFIAFLRWAEIPQALAQGTRMESLDDDECRKSISGPDEVRVAAPAAVDERIGILLAALQPDAAREVRECLGVMDEILGRDTIGLADAEMAAAAYNCIWQYEDYCRYESTVVVLGSLAAVLQAYREWIESYFEEEPPEAGYQERPYQVAARELIALLDADAFDAAVPEHLDLVRTVWEVLEGSIM